MRTRLDSLSKISNSHGPLLQSHGTAPRLVPYAMGKELFAAANEAKQFVVIPDGDRNDPQTDENYVALRAFLPHLPTATASSSPQTAPHSPTESIGRRVLFACGTAQGHRAKRCGCQRRRSRNCTGGLLKASS